MSSGLHRRGGSLERRAVTTPLKSFKPVIVVLAVLLGMGALGSLVSLASGTASGLGLGQAWINICKANTVTGTYQFSLDSGPAISIAAGNCDLIEVEDGYNTVTELPDTTGATQLSEISVTPPVDTVTGTLSVPNRTVTVNIPANQTATTTFTNVYVARIQVCKIAGTPSLVGDPFNFTYSGGVPTTTPFPVDAGTASAPVCSTPVSYPAGSSVTTTEVSIPSGVQVSPPIVTSSPSSGSCSTDVSASTATCSLGTSGGLTTVTYTDVEEPQIQVCKIAGTPSLVGDPFNFTYSGGVPTTTPFPVDAGTASAPVCSTAAVYASASSVTATEVSIPSGVQISSITSSSPSTGSCTTDVPAGTAICSLGTTGLTTVTYTDVVATQEPQIQVCKIAGTSSLVGDRFHFTYSGGVPTTPPFKLKAGTASAPRCSSPVSYASGSSVTATEVSIPTGVQVSSVTTSSPSSGSCTTDVPAGTATCSLGTTGLTTVTYTDVQTEGWLEVCKVAGDPSVDGHSFSFSVNSGAAFPVKAGNCSNPIEVPTGTATVDEIESNPDFYLKNVSTVTSTDPTGARLLSGPTQDPAMVSVPGGGVANETVVTFTNATAQATFKICTAQTSPGANLVGVPMTYSYTYTVNGTATTGSVTLDTPLVSSACSLPIGPFNVVNDDGSSVTVSVTAEVPPVTAVDLADFLYQGAGSVSSEPTFPSSFPATVSIAVGPGANVMTFTDGAAH
jgi:hypothetical protein